MALTVITGPTRTMGPTTALTVDLTMVPSSQRLLLPAGHRKVHPHLQAPQLQASSQQPQVDAMREGFQSVLVDDRHFLITL